MVDKIIPPRRLRKKSVKKLVERRVAKAIEEYEKTRADSINAGGSGLVTTGGSADVQGCSYKTFMNCKPHSFNETEGVVGVKPIEEYEKTRADSINAGGSGLVTTGGSADVQGCSYKTFMNCKPHSFNETEGVVGGHTLTWWNGNVQTLGLANANQILWSNLKAMMTNEYCPATEIQKMEQELWTLKGDDIEAYNNHFHELALMCPELVHTERKKIEKYVRGFPERIKGNITSSKTTTLHDAINKAHELVERQETARAYDAAPAEGRGYAGNLPRCNHCNSHHNGKCPPKCRKCQRTGHQEKDCRVRPLQDMTCYGCGEKGHFKDKCPK
nr:hypothetical protein [Tanacetum cinerariifolium]